MSQEEIKQSVSNFLSNNGYQVLDLFYKMPCNSCEVISKWGKFNLLPDLLVKGKNGFFFAFVLSGQENSEAITKYAKEYLSFLPFKFYWLKNKQLYEIKDPTAPSKENLLTETLSIKEKSDVGSTKRTFKSLEGKWEEKRRMGIMGEEEAINILKQQGAKIMDLNFNAPCDECSNIENWKAYNKLPDGIARFDNELFFFDAKAKKKRLFWVNERDYVEYQDKSKLLPVKIFILVFSHDLSRIREAYLHKVNFNKHEIEKSWDGNRVVNLSNDVEQLI